jgi:CO/xanthine dehydrogenase FAD-binding subunit
MLPFLTRTFQRANLSITVGSRLPMPSQSFEDYVRPRTLPEAVSLMRQGAVIVCGGTDVYPAYAGRELPRHIMDVSAVQELRGISPRGDGFRIGGATTWTEITKASLPPAFRALQQAARQVGALQVQNRGTIAGNLCNASPAADGIPPLLVLDAEVELTSAVGTRRLPLSAFITGYRKTALETGELLSAVIVPAAPAGARSHFVKLGARKYLVISIVMAAALIRRDNRGAIAEARVAVGSASEKAQRLGLLERELLGQSAVQPSAILRSEHFADLRPIDDVRATASYRADAARQLVAEALDLAAGA